MKNFHHPLLAGSGAVFLRWPVFGFTLLVAAFAVRADWPSTNATKWVQHPNSTLTGLDVMMTTPLLLADDFLCTNTGPITDIHVWASWLGDQTLPVPFILSIWTDVATNAVNPFSHPGVKVWSETFQPQQVQVRPWQSNTTEFFWDPRFPDQFEPDSVIWQYNFYPTNPFVQQGTPDQPVVYWLAVQVPFPGLPTPVGWKTSTNHWNDDATWVETDPAGNPLGFWKELVDARSGLSLDLAFALTTLAEEELLDYGDAPDQPYPTRLASNGARHTIVPGLFLGASIDGEADGQPNANATGDDLANLPDEDGVVFNTPLIPGAVATVTVTASAGQVPLNAWIDFGADGSWQTPGDQVCLNQMLNAGPNVLVFTVPPNAVVGPTFARFRYSTQPNLSPTGPASDGEVEDYPVFIAASPSPLDFGDAPDPSYPTRLTNNGARHLIAPGVFLGQAIDAEADGQPNLAANGDDMVGVNDEDGVSYVGTLVPGWPFTVTVTASVNGFLNAWIDFNGDGSWAQAGDQIFNNQPLATGVNVLTFVVPQTASWGITAYARFRFNTTGGLSYTGLAADGEVEDYAMSMEPWPQHDLGDAPSSFNNSAPLPGVPMTAYPGVPAMFPTAVLLPPPTPPYGPIHLQPRGVAFLGANVSLESNADLGPDTDIVNNLLPLANTADLDGADDGLLLPLSLPHGQPSQMSVQVTFPGPPGPGPAQMFVNAWFDWNRDGDWNVVLNCPNGALAPEWAVRNVPVNVPLPPQPYPVSVVVPLPPFTAWHPSVTNQPIWLRVTLAEQMWPPAGAVNPLGGEGPMNGYQYGETEDYWLTNHPANVEFDWGDAPNSYSTTSAVNGPSHQRIPGFHLGALIDAETDGQPDPAARGDDVTPPLAPNDEDGVTFATPLIRGSNACVTVSLTAGPSGGMLDAWVDFNRDGVWGAGEQVFASLPLVPGLNLNQCFTVPTNAVLGGTFARFRLSSGGGLQPIGPCVDGEVEDYAVNLLQRRPATSVAITNISVTNLPPLGSQIVTLSWNAEAGLEYQVQAATSLTNPPPIWSDIGPRMIGPANVFSETNSPAFERYYRVMVPWSGP